MANLPPKVSLFKMIKVLPKFVKNPIPYLTGNIKELGSTYMFSGRYKSLGMVTINPAIIQHVLQKNHRSYEKSMVQTDILGRFVGQGLLTSTGSYWLRQRRLIQPGFHKKKLVALVDIMHDETDLYFKKLDQELLENETVDLTNHMMNLAFKVVAKSLFSTGVDEEEMNQLSNNITTIQAYLIQIIRMPMLQPFFKFIGRDNKIATIREESMNVILKIIKERMAQPEGYSDLLDMLLESRYEDTGEAMTEIQVKDESLILFVAGHETSANALAWTTYLLSQHPEAVEKIRLELAEKLEGRRPTFHDFMQLEYLTQVIQESMRIYPPAWITDRVCLEDDQVEGFDIPKDSIVAPFIYGVHHDENIWPEPEKFKPERFTKEKIKERHKFAYLPFGGGPRLCIGNNFAMMEMQMIIAKMVEKYDFELVSEQPIELEPLVTLRPKNGIVMKLKQRTAKAVSV